MNKKEDRTEDFDWLFRNGEGRGWCAAIEQKETMSDKQSDPMKDWKNPIMRWFRSDHLSGDLQAISRKVEVLANEMEFCIEKASPEKSAGLRKLLEAKDCFVRAMIIDDDEKETTLS